MLSPRNLNTVSSKVSFMGSTGGRLMGYARTLYLCLPSPRNIIIRSKHELTAEENLNRLIFQYTDITSIHLNLGSLTHHSNKPLRALSKPEIAKASEHIFIKNNRAVPGDLIKSEATHQPATNMVETLTAMFAKYLNPQLKRSFNTKHYAKNDLLNFSNQSCGDYLVEHTLQNNIVVPTIRDCKVSNYGAFFRMLNGTNYDNPQNLKINYYFVGGIPPNYIFTHREMDTLLTLIHSKMTELIRTKNSSYEQYVYEDQEMFRKFQLSRCIADLQQMRIAPMIISQHDVVKYMHSLPSLNI